MKMHEFRINPQQSARANILRLHRHIRSIDPSYKPPPASFARRQSAEFWRGSKWTR